MSVRLTTAQIEITLIDYFMPRNECTWIALTDCFVPRHSGTFLGHPDEATIVIGKPCYGYCRNQINSYFSA